MRQMNLHGLVVQSFKELYEAAREAKVFFDDLIVEKLCCRRGLSYQNYNPKPILNPGEAMRSIKSCELDRIEPGPSFSWIFDIVRGEIVCELEDQIYSILSELLSGSNAAMQVVRMKNYFRKPLIIGYRCIKANILVAIRRGVHHICELEIHLKPLKQLADQLKAEKLVQYFEPYFGVVSRSACKESDEDLGLQLLALMIAKVNREDLPNFVRKVVHLKDQDDVIQRLGFLLSLLKMMDAWDLAVLVKEKIVRLLSGDTESDSVSISIDEDTIGMSASKPWTDMNFFRAIQFSFTLILLPYYHILLVHGSACMTLYIICSCCVLSYLFTIVLAT